jgi:hypothetical protein
MKRVFYSFHYKQDYWRASQVRNIGMIEGNQQASDNDWERIKSGGHEAIKDWIHEQMQNRTCTVVLIGANTANRPWINYEIIKSWNRGMGVVGIYIHGLENKEGHTSLVGYNPFDYVNLGNTGKPLSSVVKCYDPTGWDSRGRYAWIASNLSEVIDEAIEIRNIFN